MLILASPRAPAKRGRNRWHPSTCACSVRMAHRLARSVRAGALSAASRSADRA